MVDRGDVQLLPARVSDAASLNLFAPPAFHRFFMRDRPWQQASGKVRLRRWDLRFVWWFGLRPKEWYQFALSLPTTVFIVIFIALYLLVTVLFAGFYVAIHNPDGCDLSLHSDEDSLSFREAFAFSVETVATIGYGLPNTKLANNAFFLTCDSLPVVILSQFVIIALMNASLVGLLFMEAS